MQDEHFMRDWVGVRARLSPSPTTAANRNTSGSDKDDRRHGSIDRTYVTRRKAEGPARLSIAAQASLRGVAATVLTFVLWATVMVLATPTPGLASSIVEGACAAHPVLA